MSKRPTLTESEFVCQILKYDPCDGCEECVNACYHIARTAERIEKMDWRLLEKFGHHAGIRPQTAIGEIPLAKGQSQTFDYWPMIHPELCNGCGECIKACPANAISKIKRSNHR